MHLFQLGIENAGRLQMYEAVALSKYLVSGISLRQNGKVGKLWSEYLIPLFCPYQQDLSVLY